jgi:hypothetical protein
MPIMDIVNNHKGSVFFYPFSGLDFNMMNNIEKNESIREGSISDYLYIYCSVHTQQDWNNLTEDQQNGWFIPLDFIENELGLAGKKITEVIALENNMNWYKFSDNTSLIFIHDSISSFLNTLTEPLNQNKIINLIFSSCGNEKNPGIQHLIQQFIINAGDVLSSETPKASWFVITHYQNLINYFPDGLYEIVKDNEGNNILLDERAGNFLIKRNLSENDRKWLKVQKLIEAGML